MHTPTFLRILLPVLTLMGCSTSSTERLNLPELPVVQHVDVERYMGTWYEIASFPQSFQEGCTTTTATYKLRDDGQLDVINRCNKDGLDGKENVAEGRARIVDPKTNAKLEVSFFRPFWGDYWIIDLADDYSYAVVGHPGRDYLWILSRTPQIDPTIYDGIIERLKANGYEVERLNKTLQRLAPKPAEIKPAPITLDTFKEQPPKTLAPADSLSGVLAQRLLNLDTSKMGPKEVLSALAPTAASSFPWEPRSGIFNTVIETPDGPMTLSLILKPGTWEPPKGNSAPRTDTPALQGVELSGTHGLTLEIPPDAKPQLFDGESVRRFHVWGNYSYFEQGSDTHGWTVAKYNGRAPFHTTAAERDALEDAIMLLAEKINSGTKDLQVFAENEFSSRKTEQNTYDFGVGKIHVIHPYAVKATWHGPTQIPRFFRKLNVGMIETSFANDAGQVVNEIKLDELRINPIHYFITDPDSMEDEMGSAAEAKFRGLTFYFSPTP